MESGGGVFRLELNHLVGYNQVVWRLVEGSIWSRNE